MSVKSDADKIMREMWLRAARDPDGLRVDCRSMNTAKYYRMRLYRVAKAYRDAPGDDVEFFEAVQKVAIPLPVDRWLHMQQSMNAGLLGEIADQLGYNPREGDTAAIKDLGERLLERLGKEDEGTRVTPYYTRED